MPHSEPRGSASLFVQQEVDEGSCLRGVLAGLGDGQAHGDLGEAAVVIAELISSPTVKPGLFFVQSVLILGSGGIPLEAAGQLAGHPLGGLVSGVVAVGAVVGGQAHDDVAIDQALDEVDALRDRPRCSSG